MNTKTNLRTVMTDETLTDTAKVLFAYIHGGNNSGLDKSSYSVGDLKKLTLNNDKNDSLLDDLFLLIRKEYLEVTIDKGVM